jgi:hypothetical protein
VTALAGSQEGTWPLPGISSLFQIPGLLIPTLIPSGIKVSSKKIFFKTIINLFREGNTMADEPVAEFDRNKNKTSLIDCYRVALDFGLPAAERALEHLSISLPQQSSKEFAGSSYKIPG